jgi:tetratricopeptide (TPR) repeat protein
VQYAHQLLIVHRDLKPGNILVSVSGDVKLLDFGIAKILDGDQMLDVDRSLTVLPIMTPEFASPEQVRGEAITTASDVYSLGVILYLLLTSQGPYRAASRSAHDLARAVCDTEPDRPSAAVMRARKAPPAETPAGQASAIPSPQQGEMRRLSQALKGDLDSVVLKALRKSVQDRYATVDQLSEDIRRHLEGLPVAARRGTARYKLRKFIWRHAAGVAAAAAVATMLVASASISLWQAHLARVQEARAERRFNDVRELARSLVFDVHDAIQDLPGSTPARKLLIERALKYLDSLSTESGNDRALTRELAAAYERIGEVQGHFLQNNLGDSAQSLKSYQKALALWERVAGDGARDVADQLALARCHRNLANQLWATGNVRGASDQVTRAIAIDRSLPQNMEELKEESTAYQLQAEIFSNDEVGGMADASAALESVRNEEQVVALMLSLAPDSTEVQHAYQISVMKLGDVLQSAGDLPGALASFQKSLELAQRVSERDPTAKSLRHVAVVDNHLVAIQDLLGDTLAAVHSARDASDIYRRLSTADPKNELMRRGLAISLLNLGYELAMTRERDASFQALNESLAIMQTVIDADSNNVRSLSMLAGIYESRGDARMHWREHELASAEYARACEIFGKTRAVDAGDAGDTILEAECRSHLARASLALGRMPAASSGYQEALDLLKPLLTNAKPAVQALYITADSYAGLGDVGIAGGHWQSACAWYTSSLDTWHEVPVALHTRSPSLPVDGPQIVADKLQRCEAALHAAASHSY